MATVSQRPALPRWPLWLALLLVLALVVGVLIAAAVIRNQELDPLALAPVPAPAASSPDCTRLLAGLPQTLDDGELGALPRRRLVAPAPAGAAAWGEPPVVMRCGLDRPAQLSPSSGLLSVSGVEFLQIPSPGASTWVAVDRPVYVVVALPPTSGSGPLQQIAKAIASTLPRQGIELGR